MVGFACGASLASLLAEQHILVISKQHERRASIISSVLLNQQWTTASCATL